jgi:hypothetical protein
MCSAAVCGQAHRRSKTVRYFASSGHINAWSIRKGVRQFGLECVSLDPEPALIAKAAGSPDRDDVIFFTEEDTLVRFLAANRSECHFYPKTLAIPPDDKLVFSQAMRGIGESPVPFWPMTDGKCDRPPVLPLVIKPRSSWRDGRKLPRGWVCMTAEEYADVGLSIRRDGFSAEDFLIQEFMPDADVVSTCGFFDTRNHSRNLFLTTRKLLGQGGRLTTGVVVQTIPDPGALVSRTVAMLDALRYRGPFEMEFIEDCRRGAYHVLELNMRFWMQHGLFIDGCGNGLLKRYLDRDDPCLNDAPVADVRLVWVDRIALVAAIARGRWGFLRTAWRHCRAASSGGSRIVLYPDAGSTVRFCGMEMLRRIFGTFTAGRKAA